MFYILTPVNVKRRRRRRIYPKKIDGLPCYSLDLPIIKGSPDWDGIVSDEQLLLPKGIISPPKIHRYGSLRWTMEISTIIAKRYLKETEQDLVFYDQGGDYIDLFEKLAPAARKCTVFTSNKRMYENCCSSLYKSHGCFIRINSMLGLKSGIAVTDNERELELPNFKYISPKKLGGNAIKVPTKITTKLPIKVRELDLSEALCIGCGIGKAEDYINHSFCP